ncbi:hypothetical protein HEAFMP_HEAFMP_02295, partial [Dysosmobacter welbionis]
HSRWTCPAPSSRPGSGRDRPGRPGSPFHAYRSVSRSLLSPSSSVLGVFQSLFRGGQRLGPLLLIGLGGVVVLGLSESGALALAGVQHDAAGHALLGVSVLDGVVDSLHIMAVDLLGIQAEGFRLLGNVAVVQDVGGGAVQLIA